MGAILGTWANPGDDHECRTRQRRQLSTTTAVVAPAPEKYAEERSRVAFALRQHLARGAPAARQHLRGARHQAATNLVGTAMLRYVVRVPPLADLPVEDVVTLIAPSLQRYLSADPAELGLPTDYRP